MRMKLAAIGLGMGIALSTLFGASAGAAQLDRPKGEVVLTLSGQIANTNAAGKAEFDMAMLQAMPPVTFKTTTTWTTGTVAFTGVSLKALLATVGAAGSDMHSVALNDYAVDIPSADAVDGGPILAYAMDGKPMSVRDKGPLWVVYPYDSKPEYRTEEIYSRSIWQLKSIDIQK